jgi:hypothetical protein
MGFFGEKVETFGLCHSRTWLHNSFPVSSSMLKSILQNSLIAALVCLLAGIMVYGFDVFDIHRTAFQFVSTGILGSLFFFTLRQAGIRHALLVLLVFFIIMTGLLTQGYRHGMLLRDALYVTAVGLTLYLFSSRIYRKEDPRRWLYPVILGALMGALMMFTTVLLALIIHLPGTMSWAAFFPHIWPVIAMNFVIGLGLGTGFVLCEHLEHFPG